MVVLCNCFWIINTGKCGKKFFRFFFLFFIQRTKIDSLSEGNNKQRVFIGSTKPYHKYQALFFIVFETLVVVRKQCASFEAIADFRFIWCPVVMALQLTTAMNLEIHSTTYRVPFLQMPLQIIHHNIPFL